MKQSLFILALAAVPSFAQNFPPPPTAIECRFAHTPVVIDGKGDDAAWKQAQTIDSFYLPWLKEKARASKTATKAKLLWDREYLYFFADMEDADLFADIKEHDGQLWDNDVFELFFKPAEDKPGYYEFQVNAAGAVLDMFVPKRDFKLFKKYLVDGDFHVASQVILHGTLGDDKDKDKGWSVEGKIPWTDFMRTGGRPAPNETWKFALCRYDYPNGGGRKFELSTCAPLKAADFHATEDYAALKFVQQPPGKGALEKRVPMTTSKVIGSPEPPPPFQIQRVYPNLAMKFPLSVHPIPGADQMLAVCTESSSGLCTIYHMKDSADIVKLEPALTPNNTTYGIAFHPRWRENGYIYLGNNGPVRDAKKLEEKKAETKVEKKAETKEEKKAAVKVEKRTGVVRYTMQTKAPYAIDPDSAVEIISWVSDGHNGGAVVFGHDGMLYITSGDGTSDSDTWESGQDMTRLLAKLLRIDVDHPAKGKQYSVPKDNPFVNLKDARPETWALGFRNPWRMCIDDKTGHIWVGNNGQDVTEQAYLVNKGDNFGWSVTEGSLPFYLERAKAPAPIVKPTVEHHHSEARSLTGGCVYYGAKHPELVGHYLYADYSTGYMWAVKHDGTKILSHKKIADTKLSISYIGVDTKGEIVIADYQREGTFHTLVPTPRDDRPNTFPRKLSDSGLFQSVKGHVMQSSLVPYSVNSVLWSDGAQKERWLGIPGDKKLKMGGNRGWNLPDETVIVKSFSIETEPGNPASKRWIETRFLTKQKGEWFGYSYEWNDDQSEGHLVGDAGRDRDFTLQTKAGAQKFTWRYPSRSECMACHSRAANFVLGITEGQLNKVHHYNGVPENQFAMFERLGYFEDAAWIPEVKTLPRPLGGQRGLAKSHLLPKTPDKYVSMVDPADKSADLTLRVRSYLHSNCAQCHVEAGGGNSAMELAFHTPLEKMRLINVRPLHDTFGIKEALLVAPGHPERSILLQRINHRGKGTMPPLATRLVDVQAVELIREWIAKLKE